MEDPKDRPEGVTFASLIKEARQRQGWTQEYLAGASGVSRSTLIRWESGEITEPAVDQLRSAAQCLGIALEDAFRTVGWLPPITPEMKPFKLQDVPTPDLLHELERRWRTESGALKHEETKS